MTQSQALAILKTGANVFLTGEPGSGKTHLINEYVAYLRSNGVEPAITASTGIAATHIGGMTIHSWSGISIKKTLTNRDLDALMTNKRYLQRIKNTHVLIIDEISMLAADTLNMVDVVCQTLRGSTAPFGGLQVVLVGDFFQLPPIVQKVVANEFQDLDYDVEDTTPFAFRAASWARLDPVVCYLSEQHRQEDAVFLNALSAVRRAEVGEDVHGVFAARIVTQAPIDLATKLFPHNADVDRLNDVELSKLPGAAESFTMESRGAPPLIEGLIRSCLSPATLTLKVGAKVMFTKNSPEGKYVNGTLGEVVGFAEEGSPVVKTKSGRELKVEQVEWAIQDGPKVLAAITQFPLRLAWAITVHKSQGMSLDAAVIDLRSAFEYGQGYVALSRVRALSGLYLLGFNARALEVHPTVSDQDAKFRTSSALARDTFSAKDGVELANRHTDFIIASGGEMGAGPLKALKKVPTQEVTRQLLVDEHLTLQDIAKRREMTIGTIIGHVEQLLAETKINAEKDLSALKPKDSRFETIKKALLAVKEKQGSMPLSPAREILGHSFSYDEIRLARLFV